MSDTAKKLQDAWTPVTGLRGYFARAATPPDLGDPEIRRTLNALNDRLRAIDEAADQKAQQRFHLFGSARKR